MDPIHSDAKEVVRAERKAGRRRAKAIRHRRWLCFWTKPFGHEWKKTEHLYLDRYRVYCGYCVGCGKTKVVW